MVLKVSSQSKTWAVEYLLNNKNLKKLDYSLNTEKFSTFIGLVELRSANSVNKGKSTDF